MQKITLLATGSFNPITNGHLLMLEHTKNEIRDQFDVVTGYISPVNQEYGKPNLLNSKSRLSMCQLAVLTSNWINVDSWEINQSPEDMKKLREEAKSDPSFKGVPTVAVIKHLRDKCKMPIGFVCGADLFMGFENKNWWVDSEIELMVGDYLFVIERDNNTVEILKQVINKRPILQKLQDKITFIKPPVRNDVSSSATRKLLSEDKSIKYLVPDAVANYILEKSLYK